MCHQAALTQAALTAAATSGGRGDGGRRGPARGARGPASWAPRPGCPRSSADPPWRAPVRRRSPCVAPASSAARPRPFCCASRSVDLHLPRALPLCDPAPASAAPPRDLPTAPYPHLLCSPPGHPWATLPAPEPPPRRTALPGRVLDGEGGYGPGGRKSQPPGEGS